MNIESAKQYLETNGYEVIKKKWKPELLETFYFIDPIGCVLYLVWGNTDFDQDLYNYGNCFKNKEEAEKMRNTFRELLNQ